MRISDVIIASSLQDQLPWLLKETLERVNPMLLDVLVELIMGLWGNDLQNDGDRIRTPSIKFLQPLHIIQKHLRLYM